MRNGIVAILACAAAGVMCGGAAAETISSKEAADWLQYVTPLPKQIEISGAVTAKRGAIDVQATESDDKVLRQAVKEMREALGTAEGAPAFTIRLEVGGAGSAELKGLANSEQAYLIATDAEGKGLAISALTPTGAYYGWKTLQQLVEARREGDTIMLPLMRVKDWPDMQDRGLWGNDNWRHLKWMAARKMNIVEQISSMHVDKEGVATARLQADREPMVTEGPLYGMKAVPVVLHLEQLTGYGLFDAYPELRGKSDKPGVICYSQPKFPEVLRDWIIALGSLPTVEEVDVWMTENIWGHTPCLCDQCKDQNWAVLEARAIIKAWRMAQEKLPGLGLRILTSEAIESSNEAVFRELPPEVKVWYYHSLFTYTSSHAPMIRPYLAEYAAKGGWVGVCPNICPIVGFWTPMTGAAFIHARMNEFVDKGLSGLLGYAVPEIGFCRFNTEAAAEWTWNAKGRTTKEFALSWAVREGLRDPEKFAEWSETIGPVSWDVYGSEWPSGEKRGVPGKSAKRLKEGKLGELGTDLWEVYRIPWGDIKSVEQLDRDVAQAGRAVALAREMGKEEFLQESLVIQGHINAIKALWELRSLVRSGQVAEADKPAARKWFKSYADGLRQATEAMPKWEAALPMRGERQSRVGEPVRFLQGMIDEMNALATELGCGE